jgi:hypothetical protein
MVALIQERGFGGFANSIPPFLKLSYCGDCGRFYANLCAILTFHPVRDDARMEFELHDVRGAPTNMPLPDNRRRRSLCLDVKS